MLVIPNANAPTGSAHIPDYSSVAVLIGEEDGADLGMVRIDVPAGSHMQEHRHNGSDVILAPISGAVRIIKEGATTDVRTGDAVLILKDESVELVNPHDDAAELIVISVLRDS